MMDIEMICRRCDGSGFVGALECPACKLDNETKRISAPILGRTNSGYVSGSLEFNPIELNAIQDVEANERVRAKSLEHGWKTVR